MPNLDTVKKVYRGTTPVVRMMNQGTEVWPKVPVGISASSSQWDRASITIAAPMVPVDSYSLYRGGTLIYSGGLQTSHTDIGLNPSTAYTYKVDAIRGGQIASTASTNVNTPAHGDLGVTYDQLAWNYVRVYWSDPTQGGIDQYDTYLNGAYVETSYGADHASGMGLSASTAYTAMVVAYRQGVEIGPRGYTSFTTPARPTVADHFQITRSAYGSYNEAGGNRGTAELYYGYYSSTHGQQKSQVKFDIPANARDCVSWDNFQVRWWNQHHFWASGGTCNLVVHHNTNLGSYGGSTSQLTINGSTYYWPAPRNSWINGTEWFHLNDAVTPGRSTVREEFRVLGAQGLGLDSAYRRPSQDGYGYASNDTIIDVWFTRYA